MRLTVADPFVIVVDTREQTPWRFSAAVRVVRATVPSGADYTVQGLEGLIGIERKTLADLIGSLTSGRGRFMRSLERLAQRRFRAVIVEAPLSQLLAGDYRSKASPSSMLGSVCSICADFAPVLFAGDPASAAQLAERLLLKWADRAAVLQADEAAA